MQTATPSRFSIRDILRYDLPSSLVVFLVALPLSLGIAVASDAPIMAGLIAAVVGGIVAGALGGAPLQVSGPAAGLTVVVAELVANFGWKVTTFITVCAGLCQIIFGLSRIARVALAISPVVVHAMLAGIGVTIALQQLHVLLGGSSASSAWANLSSLPSAIADLKWPSLVVGGMVIAVLLAWPRLPAKARVIPGPLVAIAAATFFAIASGLDVARISLNGNFFDAVSLPDLPTGNWGAVAMGVITVALIASVESLLSAVATDKMHTGPRANFNREMIGQGSGNIVSGMLGGLPITGVIVRSTANVTSGARTRASAILHGVWVLIFAVLLTTVVERIPLAALAGLLVMIGAALVKTAHMKLAHRTGDLMVYVVTLAAVVFLNLLQGVAIGVALTVIAVVARVVRASITSAAVGDNPRANGSPPQWHISIRGSLSFLALPRLTSAVRAAPAGSDVTITIDADFLDHSVGETISEFARSHTASGGTVTIEEAGLARLDVCAEAPPKRHAIDHEEELVSR